MKSCKLLFVLLAGLSLALSSCKKSGTPGDGPNGSVTYGGKRIAMSAPIFEGPVNIDKRAIADRWKTDGDESATYKEYIIGISSHPTNETDLSKVTSFYFFTTLPNKDFEFNVSPESYSEYCSALYFFTNGKLYRTSLFFSVPELRSSSIYAVKSIGIDPETGKEYQIDKLPGSWELDSIEMPEIVNITGGKVSVKRGAETLHIEFNLTFEDGKSAKGYGEIPRALIAG